MDFEQIFQLYFEYIFEDDLSKIEYDNLTEYE